MCGIAQFGTSDSSGVPEVWPEVGPLTLWLCSHSSSLWSPFGVPSCQTEHGVQWNLDVLYWLWLMWSILRSACKKWHSHTHLWFAAVSKLSTATLFQWYCSTQSSPAVLTQSWLLDIYFNDFVLQVLPQFLLLQLFLLEVLRLYFNDMYLQVLPQFFLKVGY